ncbi:MAG TPA: helix-turn-helix transcriptional regulator [Alloacidobacterium sp.]|nr:helix-turn-helix transcriptional regulator [Alloacidobacterium sp.]
MKQDLGRVIHDLRKAVGISGWTAARAIGCSQSKLSLFESGHRQFTSDELNTLDTLLDKEIRERWTELEHDKEFQRALKAWMLYTYEAAKEEVSLEDAPANLAYLLSLDPSSSDAFARSAFGLELMKSIRRERLSTKIKEAERYVKELKAELAALESTE